METTGKKACGMVAARVKALIEEIDGPGAPANIWQLRRIIKRFEITLLFVSPAYLRTPFLYKGVMFIPTRRPVTCERLRKWILHELAHGCLLWEGEPPFVLPTEWGDWHSIARQVELL